MCFFSLGERFCLITKQFHTEVHPKIYFIKNLADVEE